MKLELDQIIGYLKSSWASLPDRRKPNNNRQYEMADAALGAFAVFLTQSASFLEGQQELQARKGQNNAATLFRIEQIPSSGQIRNLLDGLKPEVFRRDFDWLHDRLREAGQMERFVDHAGTRLIALDGLTFFRSKKLSCPDCQKRGEDCFHSAVTPVMVKPGMEHVVPLMPEFVVPQDGADKQDCEQNAAKRWLAKYPAALGSVTYLGDALYATQPFCSLVAQAGQFFVYVCKPESHRSLFAVVEEMARLGTLHRHVHKHWNGRHYELWTFRYVADVPLRGDVDAMGVNWLEVTVTHASTGAKMYFNSWVTNHAVSDDSVFGLAVAGRARWKIENENNNVLKNRGYHLEHNFGHGKEHLSNVLFTLNLLAFLTHTCQDLLSQPFQMLRAAIKARHRLFNDIRALLQYAIFDSWRHLWRFMLDGREIVYDPALLFSD